MADKVSNKLNVSVSKEDETGLTRGVHGRDKKSVKISFGKPEVGNRLLVRITFIIAPHSFITGRRGVQQH